MCYSYDCKCNIVFLEIIRSSHKTGGKDVVKYVSAASLYSFLSLYSSALPMSVACVLLSTLTLTVSPM